jgi:hypothetical protein
MQGFEATWALYHEYINWLSREKQVIAKIGRIINNKITPMISSSIKIIYSSHNRSKKIILENKIISELFLLLQSVNTLYS